MYVKLSKALVNTRDSLVDVCYPMGIDTTVLNLEELEVAQCNDCSIWLPHKQLHNGTCQFCLDMDDLRF